MPTPLRKKMGISENNTADDNKKRESAPLN
jgi:hypothetical protein